MDSIISISLNKFEFFQKLCKNLKKDMISYSDVNNNIILNLKIKNIEYKKDGARLTTDSILNKYCYEGLKGPKRAITKKNFQPVLITNRESGENLIKNSLKIIDEINPIKVDFHYIKKFYENVNKKHV